MSKKNAALSSLILSFYGLSISYSQVKSAPYFQQRVNTTMEVTLNDKNHSLKAHTNIEYINNSPDELSFIYFHLWPNAYKNVHTAMGQQVLENGELKFQFAKDDERGFIDSLDFKINGISVKWEFDPVHIDIAKVFLNEPLAPGKSAVITTPFYVKIPVGVYSRLGHIGESYQITQWFPKPAVYDREGWHPMPYLSQGEFYSEYGSYDVKITVPKNYVLGATGDLQNGEKELKWLEQKVLDTEAIIKTKSYEFNKAGKPDMSFPESSTELKTLHFKQDNVHDFAWFCDKRFHVLKGEVTLPWSKEKVTSWAMFTNSEFVLWERSIEYLNDAIHYYSLWNGDYPYKHVTAVDGSISAGGGMEYPNITVIGKSYTPSGLEQVIVHEVGHNWFYGILGSNERVNAWMDEGLNTFNETRYQEVKYPNSKMDLGVPEKIAEKLGLSERGPRGVYDIGYEFNARRNYDQPLGFSSEKFTNMNYGALVYGKTAIGLDFMKEYLGEPLFDSIMHAYFQRWKFKHPQPNDLHAIFEEKAGKDVSWFFEDFIKTTKKIDYALTGLKKTDGGIELTVKNVGQLNAPVQVFAIKERKVLESKWIDGFEGEQRISFLGNEADTYVIDYHKKMPEINRKDNQLKSIGWCKSIEPIKFEFLGSYEHPERTSIYYAPTLGWNDQDKFMLGVALYNTTIPEKKFEWLLNPMFAFGSKKPVGIADIRYHWYPSKKFRRIELGANFKSFNEMGYVTNYPQPPAEPQGIEFLRTWYRGELKLTNELWRSLRKSKQTIELRGVMVDRQMTFVSRETVTGGELSFRVVNRKILKPASLKASLLYANSSWHGDAAQLNVEAKYRWNYNIDLKGIDIRFFSGYALLSNTSTSQFNYSLTGQTGQTDFFYDHILLGRSASMYNALSQQTTNTQGDFKVATGGLFGSNNLYVGALNIKADIPYVPLIKFFTDAGIHPDRLNGDVVQFDYTGGLYIPLRKNTIEIYVPLFYSQNIANQLEALDINFMQRIRFSFNINGINPFKLVKEFTP
jgi:hypothetical protein